MPATPGPRFGLQAIAGTDHIDDIDELDQAQIAILEAKGARVDTGTFSARPTSSGGTPGISGRLFFATDTQTLDCDTGAGWIRVAPTVDAVAPSSPTRSLDVAYQPSGTRPTMVIATLWLAVTSSVSDGGVIAYIGSTSSPATQVAAAEVLNADGAAIGGLNAYVPVTFMVPPAWYYKLTAANSGGGSAAITLLVEYAM